MAFPADSDYIKHPWEQEYSPAAVTLTNVAGDATTGRDIAANDYPRQQQFDCTLSVGDMIINIPSDGRAGQVFKFLLTASGGARTVSFESGIIGPALAAGGVIASGKTRLIQIEFNGTEWFCTQDREESAYPEGIAPKVVYCIPLVLDTVANGDIVTALTPGFAGKIDKFEFLVTAVTTDADASALLNLEIGTTNTTGGVITIGDTADGAAAAATLGKILAGTAITAANTFTASDTISVEAASVTDFTDGAGVLIITCTQTA